MRALMRALKRPGTRALAAVMLVAITLLWMAAAVQGWWMERLGARAGQAALAPADDPLAAMPAPAVLAWGGDASARAWVRALLAVGGPVEDPVVKDDPRLRGLLDLSLRQRPLWAPTWLEQAELLAVLGDGDGASRRLEIARALWPGRDLLHQQAAWMQVKLGPPEQALAALLDYWRLAPGDSLRTLALARRLAGDPERLVAAAEPVWQAAAPGATALDYQRALMDLASRARDGALAGALWARLEPAARAEETLLMPYLRLLMELGQHAEADALWQAVAGDPPGLANGDFERPLVPLGREFRPGWATPGWRYQARGDGFRIGLDPNRARAGTRSLRIDFDGTANVDFGHVSQVFRVRPGGRYRLSGDWAATRLSTRSGVFIELMTLDTRPVARVHTAPRWGSWDWERFELELAVPADGLRAQVRVRRAPTRALDRLLAGSLWLDGLSVEPLEQE